MTILVLPHISLLRVQSTPVKNPICDNGASISSQSLMLPMSSACLLVAAAVEFVPLGFKFLKTKEAFKNEGLNNQPSII